MADANHQNREYLVPNLVDEAVVSHTETVETAPPCERLGSRRAGVIRESIYALLNSDLYDFGQLGELA